MKISISGKPADIPPKSICNRIKKTATSILLGMAVFLMLFFKYIAVVGGSREHPCDRSFVMLSGNA